MKKKILSILIIVNFIFLSSIQNTYGDYVLVVADDMKSGYDRAAFKLWIDEDRNGCDTRAEVLISEATVKPKLGKNCVLTGGSWLSPYDNKVQTKASTLDIDHLVPLAEAWRSGAWKWTPSQRQAYANDLKNKETLVAVTLSLNRAKGDKDVSEWLPPTNQCSYIRDWIVVKLTYGLTVDSAEGAKLAQLIQSCGITGVSVGNNSLNLNLSTQFKMPFISEYKLGALLSKWSTYGFNNQPKILQQASSLKDYSCKAISNEDTIIDIQPKWNTLVDANTQVTVTVICTIDFESKKVIPSATPSISSLPNTSATPAGTATRSVTPTLTPTPTNTRASSPTPTPTTTFTSSSIPTPTPTTTSAPTASSNAISWPNDSTAKCKDGTFSYSKTRSGTCSGHGGVETWRNP